jgi:hypothetical protein
MNVNLDKKCIFLCHPKTGEKDIAEYFGKVGFHYQISENRESKPLYRNWFSYKTFFPWIYDDFSLIVSIDNPYRRLVNDYKEYSSINWKLKKNQKSDLYHIFNETYSELLADDLEWLKYENNISESKYASLLPYDFSCKKPDYIINIESIVSDIQKIDFLDHVDHDFHLLDQLDLSDDYKDVFSYENARSVFKSHKHIFELMSYDPFSFTTRELSREEKIKFIHY